MTKTSWFGWAGLMLPESRVEEIIINTSSHVWKSTIFHMCCPYDTLKLYALRILAPSKHASKAEPEVPGRMHRGHKVEPESAGHRSFSGKQISYFLAFDGGPHWEPTIQ